MQSVLHATLLGQLIRGCERQVALILRGAPRGTPPADEPKFGGESAAQRKAVAVPAPLALYRARHAVVERLAPRLRRATGRPGSSHALSDAALESLAAEAWARSRGEGEVPAELVEFADNWASADPYLGHRTLLGTEVELPFEWQSPMDPDGPVYRCSARPDAIATFQGEVHCLDWKSGHAVLNDPRLELSVAFTLLAMSLSPNLPVSLRGGKRRVRYIVAHLEQWWEADVTAITDPDALLTGLTQRVAQIVRDGGEAFPDLRGCARCPFATNGACPDSLYLSSLDDSSRGDAA
ncbi:MAG TPA: PD-(D/E)XK nuclease family protein [Chloroflexota bacterium]|nr:PD-(D/E)XK nuclease family protein [Chloroflexota bacterium]